MEGRGEDREGGHGCDLNLNTKPGRSGAAGRHLNAASLLCSTNTQLLSSCAIREETQTRRCEVPHKTSEVTHRSFVVFRLDERHLFV